VTTEAATEYDVPQLGDLVRQYRVRIGLTQRALSDLSMVSVRTIRNLELGRAKRPRQDTIALIANGLRLGPRARAELIAASGQSDWAVKRAYDMDPPGPPNAHGVLLGRESEVSALVAELTRSADGLVNLVNLVGLAGVGKTRLAMEVARRLHAENGYPVLWFSFSDNVAGRKLTVPGALADIVRGCVTELFESDADCGGIAEFLELVEDGPALLVVDDTANRVPRAHGLNRLANACPDLRLLTTSDTTYGIPGERQFMLCPLTSMEACTRLFLSSALHGQPTSAPSDSQDDIALVTEICQLLDGLPLAIQGAASWMVVYDLATLRDCLRASPASLLSHAAGIGAAGHLSGTAGGDDSSRLIRALRRSMRSLPAESAALLAALLERGNDFGLEEVIALTGLSLSDCARLVHDLLVRGMVRLSADRNRRFEMLNLVRAFQLT
jgi:transcriptional regulator with XRE-family HTH domain